MWSGVTGSRFSFVRVRASRLLSRVALIWSRCNSSLRAGAAIDVLLLRRSALAGTCRLKHRRRAGLRRLFLFRPRPTHHATARLRCRRVAPCARIAVSTPCRSRAPHALPSPVGSFVAAARSHRPCDVTSLAAGFSIVHGRPSLASAAPAPSRGCSRMLVRPRGYLLRPARCERSRGHSLRQ